VEIALRDGVSGEAKLTPENQKHWPAMQGSWLARATPVHDEMGAVIGAIELSTNITCQERLEKELKAALEEKDTLLRELVHRVKNSLSMVSSLQQLEAVNVTDLTALKVLKASQDRIKSIAITYDLLNQKGSLSFVDFRHIIQHLAANISASFVGKGVALTITADPVRLESARAVPLALIINELITNAFKYAFPAGDGTVTVEVRADGESRPAVTIHDDGIGFPENLDFREAGSLGLRIVNSLVNQIRGTIDMKRDNGTTFTIKF